MRKIFYKIDLVLPEDKALPVTLATSDMNSIPTLVEKSKTLYNSMGYDVQGFRIADTRYTLNMSDEEYETELMFCDIIEE